MPFLSVCLVLAGQTPASTPITLEHKFTRGEKLAYQVLSHITAEERQLHLDTWIPSDVDVNYNFAYTVTKLAGDGNAVIHYLRPTMTEITGETAEHGPVTNVGKVNVDSQLTVSPINEILEQKDLGKPNKENWIVPTASLRTQGPMNFFGPFISDIHRLALFIGSVQDALDFSPKFPLNPIKVGDTWQKTIGFEPQALKGSKNKQAVQRIDYTYTYLGPMTVNGKSVVRVEGKLNYKNDTAALFKQLLGDQASKTDVSKVPLHFESVIDFDLDPTTKDLLHGEGKTSGGFQLFVTEEGDNAVIEERFKGRTTIDLVGKKLNAIAK